MKRTRYKIDFIKNIEKNIQNIFDSFSQNIDDIRAILNAYLLQAEPIIEQFQENLDKLPESTANALLVMANQGWYLDPKMPWNYIFILSRYIDEGKTSEVDLFLTEYFTERLDDIENKLIDKFPHRAKIINSAFNAHKREEYELSIPVFLIQIDSICQELYGELFFWNKDKKPRTAQYVMQQEFNPYKNALLKPLSETTSINMTKNQRKEFFTGLNRHMILHGESIDYGTQTNSVKAISLLNYVSNILSCV